MINKIAPDKWRHFFAGIMMGAVLQGIVFWWWPENIVFMTVAAFVVVVAISYGFEVFSKITGKGYYDLIDAVASVIGGVAGMGLVILLIVLFRT